MRKIILISTLVLVAALGAVVGVARGAVPREALSPAGSQAEGMRAGPAGSPDGATQLQAARAQERLAEIPDFQHRNEGQNLSNAMSDLIGETGLAPVETATPVETESDQPAKAENCTGTVLQPHAQQLAEALGVSYKKIMKWYCQGYGFGEIQLAYRISQQKDIPVKEVFEKRAEGEGWGKIMQAYGLIGNPGKSPKDKSLKSPQAPADEPRVKPEQDNSSDKFDKRLPEKGNGNGMANGNGHNKQKEKNKP